MVALQFRPSIDDSNRCCANPVVALARRARVLPDSGDNLGDAGGWRWPTGAAFGLKPNDQKFYPYADSPNWWQQQRAVIPDAVMPLEDTIVTMSDKPGIPASVEKHRLDNGFMVEVKATSGPVTLTEPREQLQKYIDYLSKAHNDALPNDRDTPQPVLLYIATSEAQIDPAALAYADQRGVAIWRAQMYETGSPTDPHIAVGAPDAQNNTARQRLDGLVVSPVMRPAPLFNSPYDALLRRNQLQDEAN